MTSSFQGQWERRGVRDQDDARTRVGGEGHEPLGDAGIAMGRPEVSLVTSPEAALPHPARYSQSSEYRWQPRPSCCR